MKKNDIVSIKVSFSKKKLFFIINCVLYVLFGIFSFFVIQDYPFNSYICWILFVVFLICTLIIFEKILKNHPALYPYKNLLPTILGLLCTAYSIRSVLYSMDADILGVLNSFVWAIVPFGLGICVTIGGFVFDGVRKIMSRRKAKLLN